MRTRNVLFVLLVVLMSTLVACGTGGATGGGETGGEAAEGLSDLEGREIFMAVENAYPPFNYIDEDTGEAIGWDYDMGREICERLNCVPVFTEAAWDGLFPAMAANEYDVAFDGITFTEERDETVDFSLVYTDTGQVLLVQAGEDRFTTPDEFAADEALLIATQIVTTNYDVAVELVGVDRVQGFEDFPAAVQALLAGDADAVVTDTVSSQGFMDANPGELTTLDTPVVGDPLALVFPPDSELIEPFNAALMAMMEDGTLNEINDTWGLPPHPEP